MTDFLENSIIVAAHPDDEMLWFTSIVKDVDSILLVYEDAWPTPDLGPARARALADVSAWKHREPRAAGSSDIWMCGLVGPTTE